MVGRKIVACVLFARDPSTPTGRTYVLSFLRPNEPTNKKPVIYGPGGKVDAGEGLRKALLREANEELGIKQKEVLKIRKVGMETTTTHGSSGHYYVMEVPFKTLIRVAHKINQKPAPFRESRKARIIRVQTMGKNKKLLQPHYKKMLPTIKTLLSRLAQKK